MIDGLTTVEEVAAFEEAAGQLAVALYLQVPQEALAARAAESEGDGGKVENATASD